MDLKMYDIIIVGGGSAGWMSAATLIKEFPDKKIALIESPEISTIGVGESTIQQIRLWTKFLGIKDDHFLKHTDGTYKLSIKFTDFYKKGESFHYPFGKPVFRNTKTFYNDWWLKKYIFPKTPYTDYADCYFPQMALVNNNKLSYNERGVLDNFNLFSDAAFHFDAIKFGLWLRDFYSIPKGVVHIKEHIDTIEQSENGEIESLNEKYKANLYIDCTGFASLLLGKTLNVPFQSYLDILPNNSAWATKLPYKNKEKEIVNHTNCKAVENGWIWNIPLWSRIGTGYVYSDNFIDDDSALKQFQKHLGTDESEFKKIKMRVGIHEKLWEKNVVAIGLSSGFIEPLESSGLFTVHEFLRELIRDLKRDRISQWDRDGFTHRCKTLFRRFAEFVSLHYVLSHRNDTEYWKHIQERSMLKEENKYMVKLANARLWEHSFHEEGGIHAIATGMHYSPTDISEIMWLEGINEETIIEEWTQSFNDLERKKGVWEYFATSCETSYEFLKNNIYN